MQPQDPLQPNQIPPAPGAIPPQLPTTPADNAITTPQPTTPSPQPTFSQQPPLDYPQQAVPVPQTPAQTMPQIPVGQNSNTLPPQPLAPATQATVNTAALFQADPFVQQYDEQMPVQTKASKSKLIMIVVALLIFGVAGSGLFLLNRSKNDSSTQFNESDLQNASAALDDAALTAVADDPLADSSTPAESEEKTPDNTSGSTSTGTDKPSSTASTPSTKSSTKTTSTSKVTCKQDTNIKVSIPAGAIKQVETSVNTATAGKAESLLSWLDKKYHDTIPDAQPANVNKTFKSLKPKTCNVKPVIIRKKNDYSTAGIAFIVIFDKNAHGTPYSTSINTALVNGKWRTDRILTAIKE